jgi:hypothetical protein
MPSPTELKTVSDNSCSTLEEEERNRVTTSLGAKQGLTIVHFLNKLIVSCKEAVRFPLYFFWGGGYF